MMCASLDRYRASLRGIKRLDAEEEHALAVAYRNGDTRAGDRLICACLPFVIRIAREYRRFRVPMEDLVQQGSLGLLKAAAKFEPARKCRLATYAAFWIRAEIRDYVVRCYRIVRLGTTRTERRAMRVYRRESVESPEELAARSGMPKERATLLWALLTEGDMPLDHAGPGRTPAVERVAALAPSPEEQVCRHDITTSARPLIGRALAELSARERRIVEARMLAESPRTLEELGREMGVSKERVRQLEARIREKLRQHLSAFEPVAA